MQGASPLASPGLNLRGTGSPCQSGTRRGGAGGRSPADLAIPAPAGGGLLSLSPAYPAFGLLSCPLSPRPPSPVGKGENQSFLMQGASPLASPGLNPCSTGSPCRCGKRNGGLPRRHWLALPRGRGPSQTPKFLSPGPPSPWLPALLIGNRFLSFLRQSRISAAGYLLGRFCKCRKRLNAGVPGAKPPAK